MTKKDLYSEILKYYEPQEWKIAKLQHAQTLVESCLDAVTELEYESYLKAPLYKVKYELARQLSCATKKPLL